MARPCDGACARATHVQVLESLPTVEADVHGAYYRVAADYHKRRHDFTKHYREALRFLGCVDVLAFPGAARRARARWAGESG